jgi:hypothetical protein
MILFGKATGSAEGTAAKLAGIAQHAMLVRLTVVLTLLTFVYAVVLGVTLYALTRDEDRDLAMIALSCRVGEGLIGAVSGVRTLGLLSLATASTAVTAADTAATNALGDLLLKQGGGSTLIGATCFAVGSTLFSYLFLRARSIPVTLAWLGVIASVLLVVAIPLQLSGLVAGAATYIWIPMLVFEVTFALWLIVKGSVAPSNQVTSIDTRLT